MNNSLENILMDQKQKQRTFGITENLLEKPVPRFYGAGDHKVQLAYITPDEAKLLADLDLHDSSPPNPGPGGIPNFNDPGKGISGSQMSAAEKGDVKGSGMSKSEVAGIQAGFNAAAAGKQASQDFMNNQNQNQNTTTPVQEDEQQYTNNILDALFNKDLKFQYNPKMDYLNRMYGRIPDYRKQKYLDSIGYTGDFDSFLNEYGDALYDQQNITFKDLASIPGQVADYFQGIPNALNTNLTNPNAYKTMGQNIFSGIFANPFTTIMGANPLGLPLGLFASLAFGKGPYTQDSITSGNYADLTNAPPDYRDAVLADMKAKGLEGFSPEQMAQMGTGFLNQQQQLAATQGPQDVPFDQEALDQQNIQEYMDSLSESELARYEQLINSGYSPDYAKAYLGMM